MDSNPTTPPVPQPVPVQPNVATPTVAPAPVAAQPQTMVAANSSSGGSKKVLITMMVIILLIAAIAGGAYAYMTYLAPKPAPVTDEQTNNAEQSQQEFEDLNSGLRAVDGGGEVESDFVEVDQDLQAL